MKIIVCSCDKNADLFEPFHHCMEKYYPKHPEVIYFTETVENPYYKTICKNYPIDMWSRRIRESLSEVKDDVVLLMLDDVFIRNRVDVNRIKYIERLFGGRLAFVNFEKEFGDDNEDIGLDRIKRRKSGLYRISLMCGLWDRNKLMDILSGDHDPWFIEIQQNDNDFEYYINSGDHIIDWGHEPYQWFGIIKGKWLREVVPFFEKEGIEIDYSKRGFSD